jgi:ABC-2 type transport system permease protein
MGIAAFVGAYLPGTAPRTGGNPFGAQSGAAAQGCVTAIVSFVAPVVLLVPVVVVAVLLAGTSWSWLSVLVGLGWGLAVVAGGIELGGRRLDARGPEMLGLLARAQL